MTMPFRSVEVREYGSDSRPLHDMYIRIFCDTLRYIDLAWKELFLHSMGFLVSEVSSELQRRYSLISEGGTTRQAPRSTFHFVLGTRSASNGSCS
jgi:hypothetical protein